MRYCFFLAFLSIAARTVKSVRKPSSDEAFASRCGKAAPRLLFLSGGAFHQALYPAPQFSLTPKSAPFSPTNYAEDPEILFQGPKGGKQKYRRYILSSMALIRFSFGFNRYAGNRVRSDSKPFARLPSILA